MPRVDLTNHLYTHFPALEGRALEVEGGTVAEVLAELEALAPGIGSYLCDERGRLRQHVNVFVGRERVRDRVTLTDPVEPDGRLLIVQALSGG